MNGPLEASITLEEVFAVVVAKRVPLAPELAGYLTLEIAEGTSGVPGAVDTNHVYIGEEGSVALVRPKRDGAPGDAEQSVREILRRLLDASGSHTPALAAAAKRSTPNGIPQLVEELEAALIPVNRAAGRRALARLAREVKRVTLGVGRNASVPTSERGPRAAFPSSSGSMVQAQPASASGLARPASSFEADEPPAVQRPVPHGLRPIPTTELAGGGLDDIDSLLLAGAGDAGGGARLDDVDSLLAGTAGGGSSAPPAAPDRRDEVDSLLAQFEVSDPGPTGDAHLRELKAIAGLEPTAAPPGVAMRSPGMQGVAMRSPGMHGSPGMQGAAIRSPGMQGAAARAPGMQGTPGPSAIESALTSMSPHASRAASASGGGASGSSSALPTTSPALRASAVPPQPERRAPSATQDVRLRAMPTVRSARRTRSAADRVLVVFLLVLLGVALAGLAWFVKPGFLTGRAAAEKAAAERAAVEAQSAKNQAQATQAACKASLTITDVPNNAEVLLREGQAPVDVERMPVGTRLEFVATAEGFMPKRTVLPANASWDKGADGKPRFEVAVQLDPTKAKGSAVDPWPPAEAGSDVGGKGAPGTVHIVSTPRGAEVWLLAGLGPEATIADLPCSVDLDVLVAGPTSLRKRLHVKAADFAAVPGSATARRASLSAK